MSKAKAKTYKSEAMAAVHEMMEGLHDAGSIDKRTMREFDEALKERSDPAAIARGPRARARGWRSPPAPR